ncbi:MAG: DtxR family transcriptional regulator, Mn-dependent transcriptional regulator [Deferribacteres bacterium]|jgi:DtxR family Mn-dependent transcriptional regulator|nr:iron (metal) dependent repressor, DtxR family [Deferribacteraceae bacterium]MDK2792919.1 DtxR family transcriptional regulator, Mn-dependent transcriptional regulator [Deferribacteres bacterium]
MDDKLTKNMEDYLEAILILEKKNRVARATDISEMLSVKKPSVTNALKFLSDKGYVNYNRYRGITLTKDGMKYAKEIYHRHQKIKEFLVKILNVDDAEAEENACRIEHVIDEHIFKKLSCFLDFILDSDTKCVNIDKFKSECDEN